MVARRDGDVACAGILEGANPFVGIELRRIEAAGKLSIFLIVDFPAILYPFALAEHGVDAPVNEDAELVVLELLARLEVLRCGRVGLCKACRSEQQA